MDRKGRGLSQLQKEDGGIEEDQAAVAGLAKEYLKRLGKGCWDSEESGMDEVRWSPGGECAESCRGDKITAGIANSLRGSSKSH